MVVAGHVAVVVAAVIVAFDVDVVVVLAVVVVGAVVDVVAVVAAVAAAVVAKVVAATVVAAIVFVLLLLQLPSLLCLLFERPQALGMSICETRVPRPAALRRGQRRLRDRPRLQDPVPDGIPVPGCGRVRHAGVVAWGLRLSTIDYGLATRAIASIDYRLAYYCRRPRASRYSTIAYLCRWTCDWIRCPADHPSPTIAAQS